jgi:hypothetical protein
LKKIEEGRRRADSEQHAYSRDIQDQGLEGDILINDQLDSPPVVVDKRDHFLMSLDEDCRLENYEQYEIWWWYWQPVYNARGPKW